MSASNRVDATPCEAAEGGGAKAGAAVGALDGPGDGGGTPPSAKLCVPAGGRRWSVTAFCAISLWSPSITAKLISWSARRTRIVMVCPAGLSRSWRLNDSTPAVACPSVLDHHVAWTQSCSPGRGVAVHGHNQRSHGLAQVQARGLCGIQIAQTHAQVAGPMQGMERQACSLRMVGVICLLLLYRKSMPKESLTRHSQSRPEAGHQQSEESKRDRQAASRCTLLGRDAVDGLDRRDLWRRRTA